MRPLVVYRDEDAQKDKSWIRFLLGRIRNNMNNLIVVTGRTGSGKSYSAISICEMISKVNKVPFTLDNIVFSLRDLMALINSKKVKKGSCIIFDEPQISISSREFQTEANKVFNYLVSTFRHRNLTLFFCTPYEDLLDKASRKLFHAKFLVHSLNRNKNTCKIIPYFLDYNSALSKWFVKFLLVRFKDKKKQKYFTSKVKFWDIPKPSDSISIPYEEKKKSFTTDLN